MPEGPDALRTEVAQLKRQVAAIEQHLSQLVVREAQVGERRNPRLAITVPDPYTTLYPEIATEPDTYWINFLDASFTRVQGKQGNTQRKRQKDGEEFTLAQNTMGGTRDAYVPEGSLVEVTAEVTPTGLKQWWFTRIDPEQDDSSGGITIDVLICEPWNRCGNYLIFPQRRLYLPPGATVTTIADGVVPLYECESSGDYPPESDGEPPDSDAESSDYSWDLYVDTLTVTGALTPDATGVYTYGGYFNGKPYWTQGGWFIYWSDVFSCWRLYDGTPGYYWYKLPADTNPLGYYHNSTMATGVAHAAITPL